MAGSRRKGGKKAKDRNLSIGDLVLAKVKGFPAWPAKISRPEDWDQEPDPKKYFIQFFGKQEIAFVAPADIQAFSSETKNKLSARCQGKKNYFAQAVKEICFAFEELQNGNSSSLKGDTDREVVGCEVSSVDGAQGGGLEVNLKDGSSVAPANGETVGDGKDHPGSKLVRCSQRDETGDEIKPTISSSQADGSLSQVMSSDGEQKECSGSKVKENPFRERQKSKQSGIKGVEDVIERQKGCGSASLRDDSGRWFC